jgi:hypothetical protein
VVVPDDDVTAKVTDEVGTCEKSSSAGSYDRLTMYPLPATNVKKFHLVGVSKSDSVPVPTTPTDACRTGDFVT